MTCARFQSVGLANRRSSPCARMTARRPAPAITLEFSVKSRQLIGHKLAAPNGRFAVADLRHRADRDSSARRNDGSPAQTSLRKADRASERKLRSGGTRRMWRCGTSPGGWSARYDRASRNFLVQSAKNGRLAGSGSSLQGLNPAYHAKCTEKTGVPGFEFPEQGDNPAPARAKAVTGGKS
jgi:hypothetical protein